MEMCFDITEEPKFKNYHANREYLAGLTTMKNVIFLNIISEKISIPLFKRYLDNNQFDLFSPIGFQPYIHQSLWPKLLIDLKEHLEAIGVISIYILSKNDLSNIVPPYGFNLSYYRTNYYIELSLSLEEWLQKLKRDSRQRLKKALHNTQYKVINTVVSDEFVSNYCRIAKAKGFPRRYLFSMSNFIRFNNADNVVYLELRSHNNYDFIAGGFFGCDREEVDYLFGADSPDYKDAIRLLIYEARNFFKKNKFKRLYLGGGIKEGDSLAMFKERMGTKKQICSSVRAVINIEQAEKIYGNKFSEEWFKGFFPPYVKEIVNG